MSAPLIRQSGPSQVRRPLLRRAFLLALIPAVILAVRIAKADVVHVPTSDGGEWTMTISPATVPVSTAPFNTVKTEPKVEQVAVLTEPAEVTPADPAPAVEPPAESSRQPSSFVSAQQPAAAVGAVENGVQIVPNPIAVPQVSVYEKIYNAIPFNRTEYLANPSYRHETTMELLTGNQRQIVVHRNYTPRLNEPIERQPLFLYNNYGGYYGGGMGYGFPGRYGFGYGFNSTPGFPPAFRYFLPIEDAY